MPLHVKRNFLGLSMCVGELVTDDDDDNNDDNRQFMIVEAPWHSANEPKCGIVSSESRHP